MAERAVRLGGRVTVQKVVWAAGGFGASLSPRTRLLAGPRIRNVLGSRPELRGAGPFAARLAAARTAVLADAGPPLSEREVAVLSLLPSLLSAGEIAAGLTVSVNTVKSHIRSLYTKLGASSRREAVQRAQQWGLLP